MKYKLKRPCPHCPFRADIPGYLRGDRAVEIAQSIMNGATFPCHETTVENPDDDNEGLDLIATEDSQMCAGAMIMLESMEMPNQIMRIAERFGMYDHTALDMTAPVFKRVGDFIGHHAKQTA